MEIYTIGFAQKSAAQFFGILERAGIRRLVDIRLNNRSQLAGFTKLGDLEFFLQQLCGAEYCHEQVLSPTKDILDAYKKKEIPWEEFEARFMKLLAEREVEKTIDRRLFDVPAVLLCSEPQADRCHRSLVAEYLGNKWGGARIVHL